MPVVIKLFSVTLPVNAAETPLVIVKLLMATDVPVIAPPVPAFKPKANAPLMPAPKVIAAPAAEPPELVVSITTGAVVKATVLLKITLSPEVVKSTPAIVAALATVNALSKVEPTVANVTPDPPAVRVVMPVIVPPPITPFTVIVPDAVIFNAPVLVTKSSSASVRLKPAPAVPKNTSTPVLLVMLTSPATFMAAPITTSPALAMASDESCAEFPTVELNVTVPAPAVSVRACAPFSASVKVRAPPLVLKFTGPPESVVVPVTVRPSKPLHVMPSKVTPPANELAVLPSVRVTSPWKLVALRRLEETIPLAPPTLLWKSTKPVVLRVIAAPVPEPIFVSAPTKFTVLAVTVRFRAPPETVPLKSALAVPPGPAVKVTAPVESVSVLEKAIAPDVVKFTPAIVAALATVKALLKLEPPVENVTPVPPAVRVVMPVITPPLVTPSTVMVPAPTAVMFNAPVVMSKARSALSRLKSAAPPAVPKNTFTFELLVMLIFAPAFKVGAAVKLRSLAVIDRFPPIVKVPKSSRFASVIATSNAPLLDRLTKPPKLFACVRVIAALVVTIFVMPPIVSAPV